MENLVILTEDRIKALIKEVFRELKAEERNRKKKKLKSYSINQARKILGRAHKTVSHLVATGVIESTADGRITEEALEKYLNKEK